jgi:hypothetical protein
MEWQTNVMWKEKLPSRSQKTSFCKEIVAQALETIEDLAETGLAARSAGS